MSRRTAFITTATAGLVSLALGAQAQTSVPKPAAAAAQTPAPSAAGPKVPFEKFTLDNGLTVLLHRDASLPIVAVELWYRVGPVNEPPGRSGFAHLFEHLMFEGSRHVGREFDKLLESIGATNVNGTTSWDRTNYFETVPREHLELVLWIESDRMGFLLDAVDQERLDVQRDVVKNERRQSYENAPYGPSTLAMLDAMFPAGHPYHGAVIGSMEDLSAATLDDVRDFFGSYYAPSNAVLALAGDIDSAGARTLVEKYFGGMPKKPKTHVARPTTPPLAKPIRLTVNEPVDLARVSFGWITPPAYTPADTVLDVTMAILGGGRATLLYQELVVKQKLASEVSAELDSNALASMTTVSGTAASGKTPEELEKAMDRVLETLATKGPTPAELERAKRRIRLSVLSDLELLNGHGGESGRAGMLLRFEQYTGDPGYLPKWLAALDAVSASDVAKAVRDHLKRDARVVVVTRPAEKPAAPAAPATKKEAP
jgi:zinc protease